MELKENNIKEKLEKRRITPSDEAWNKLETKLDGQKQKSKKGFWWIGIAASFLLGILISGLFYSNQNTEKTTKIANGKQDVQTVKETTPSVFPKLKEIKPEPIQFEITPLASNTIKKESRKIDSPQIVKSQPIPAKVKPKEEAPKFNETTQETDDLNVVIASIMEKAKTQSQTHEVTDAEIDKLIREAQFRIKAESAFKASKNTVNANVLLQEVEFEMDKSLKDRVFKAIKDGLHKAKIMVASRDY